MKNNWISSRGIEFGGGGLEGGGFFVGVKGGCKIFELQTKSPPPKN